MNHEFEVWARFTQDRKTIYAEKFYSYKSFEDCWEKIFDKEKELSVTYPNVKAERLYSAVSQRPDYPDY